MTRKPTGAKAVAGLAIVLAAACSDECPLSGVKRTSPCALHMSAFDPKRTSGMVGKRPFHACIGS